MKGTVVLLGAAAGLWLLGVQSCGASTAQAIKPAPSVPLGVQYLGTTDTTFRQPANNTPYECGRLTVRPGVWRLSYRVMVYSSRPKDDTGTVSAFAYLAAPGIDGLVQDTTTGGRVGGNSYRAIWTLSTSTTVALSRPATFSLVVFQSEGDGWDSLQCLGGRSSTVIRAERLG